MSSPLHTLQYQSFFRNQEGALGSNSESTQWSLTGRSHWVFPCALVFLCWLSRLSIGRHLLEAISLEGIAWFEPCSCRSMIYHSSQSGSPKLSVYPSLFSSQIACVRPRLSWKEQRFATLSPVWPSLWSSYSAEAPFAFCCSGLACHPRFLRRKSTKL